MLPPFLTGTGPLNKGNIVLTKQWGQLKFPLSKQFALNIIILQVYNISDVIIKALTRFSFQSMAITPHLSSWCIVCHDTTKMGETLMICGKLTITV